MQGQSVLWIPGCDHAGIATQVVVERLIEREYGQSRREIGPDKFKDIIWEWKHK